MLDPSVARLAGLVYFTQGALGIVQIALPLYLKELGFSISQIAYIQSASAFPWFLKILYGAVSDSLPIRGLRRKPYLFISSGLAMAGWLWLAFEPKGFILLILVLAIVNLGFAVTDVITDGLIVEKSDSKTAPQYQSIAWGLRSLGAVASGVLGGYLASWVSYRTVFALAAGLPLITLVYSQFVHEEKTAIKKGLIIEPLIRSAQQLLSGPPLFFSIVLMVFTLSASFSTPYFFHLKDKIGLEETALGMLSSVSWAGAIFGTFIYGRFLAGIHSRTMLLAGVGINVISVLALVGVVDFSSAMIIFFAGGLLGYLALLPLFAYAARISHGTGVEGSLFALLMSIHNLGTIAAGLVGGFLYPMIGLSFLMAGTALCGLAAIPFILKLK